jgi:hypothetical protein
VFKHCPRDANTSSIGQTLNPSSYIDPIAVDSLFFVDYISKVDSNAKGHSAILGQFRVPDFEFLLDLYGTTHRIHGTGKLSQYVVSGGVYYPASVFLDDRGNHFPVSSYGSDSGFLVFGHEAAVAFGIST